MTHFVCVIKVQSFMSYVETTTAKTGMEITSKWNNKNVRFIMPVEVRRKISG